MMGIQNAGIRVMKKSTRNGMLKGHPELDIECPQCHSAVGRTCFMAPGYWGITHTVRKVQYQRQFIERKANV